MPTTKARELVQELERGSGALVSNALLPGYYETLDTLLDYVPANVRFTFVDPVRIQQALTTEAERAEHEHAARADRPTFALSDYYMDEGELVDCLLRERLTVVHALAVRGAAEELSLIHI